MCVISYFHTHLALYTRRKKSSMIPQNSQGFDLEPFPICTRLRVLKTKLSSEEP